jgi:predicted CopG family antitoxin
VYDTHTKIVSKEVTITDDVYRRLKREKGDRSFSELIAENLDSGGWLADVAGQGVLDPDAHEAAREEIERLSAGTMDRLDDDIP